MGLFSDEKPSLQKTLKIKLIFNLCTVIFYMDNLRDLKYLRKQKN